MVSCPHFVLSMRHARFRDGGLGRHRPAAGPLRGGHNCLQRRLPVTGWPHPSHPPGCEKGRVNGHPVPCCQNISSGNEEGVLHIMWGSVHLPGHLQWGCLPPCFRNASGVRREQGEDSGHSASSAAGGLARPTWSRHTTVLAGIQAHCFLGGTAGRIPSPSSFRCHCRLRCLDGGLLDSWHGVPRSLS